MSSQDRPPKGQNRRGGKREGAGRPRGRKGGGAAFKELRELARAQTEDAILRIVDMMRTSDDPRLRLSAAKVILDRAFGKPRKGRIDLFGKRGYHGNQSIHPRHEPRSRPSGAPGQL